MKIAFILPSIRIGGPQNVVKTLSSELVNQNYFVKIFYFDDLIGTKFNCPTEQIGISEWKKVQGFDVVHTHGIRPDLFIFIWKSKLKAKTISTVHSYIKKDLQYSKGKFLGLFWAYVWSLVLIRHDKVALLSKDMKKYFSNFSFNKNLFYVYNSVEPKMEIEPIDSIDNDNLEFIKKKKLDFFILGNVSYITKLKGLHQIINILPSYKNIFFVVVGEGEEKESLITLAKNKNVISQCLFVGYKKDPTNYLKTFDIFALPSYTEGFPISLLEAAYYKKPALLSNLEIYRELFAPNEVETFELDNEKSLSLALEKLQNNLSVYSQNIYDKVIEKYTPKNTCRDYLELYKS